MAEENSEKEVEEILKLKIDDLDDMDLDDEFAPSEEEEAEYEKLIQELNALPGGEDGLKKILESPSITMMDRNIEKAEYSDEPIGEPYENEIQQIKAEERTETYKDRIKDKFNGSAETVESIFKKVSRGEIIHFRDIIGVVESFMNIFKSDRCILLNFSNYDEYKEDYLYQHTLKVCLLSMNLATALGYSKEQVIDIGVGGLLADIGMVLIPPSIRFKTTELDRDDRFDLERHPMVGIHVVEKVKGIPAPVAYVAYQHHERVGGQGYPKQRRSVLIHNYAKITAIADVYVALTSQRSYRPAFKPYDAMVQILKMASSNKFDRDFVKKFVEMESLFPVGSRVLLSNQKEAKVIEANGPHVDKPVVSILNKEGEEEKEIIDLSSDTEIKIVEALPRAPTANKELMKGF